jgi:hypothetical protein
MLSPHRAPLKRGIKAGSLFVHQLTAPFPRSGFVLRPAPALNGMSESSASRPGSRPTESQSRNSNTSRRESPPPCRGTSSYNPCLNSKTSSPGSKSPADPAPASPSASPPAPRRHAPAPGTRACRFPRRARRCTTRRARAHRREARNVFRRVENPSQVSHQSIGKGKPRTGHWRRTPRRQLNAQTGHGTGPSSLGEFNLAARRLGSR